MDITNQIDRYLTEATTDQNQNLDAVIMSSLTAVARFKGGSKDSPARFQALTGCENLLMSALLTTDQHMKQGIMSRAKSLYGFAKTVK